MAGALRYVSVEERRARLGLRHRLASGTRAATAAEVARDLVALHSTDPASVFLSVNARTWAAEPAGIEGALYEERSLIRLLGMRRTVFVVPTELAPVVQAACTRGIATRERRRFVQVLAAAGIGDGSGAWLAEVEEATVRALLARGEATGAELSQDVPGLRTRILQAEGKAYQTVTNISTRVLFLLAADGRIVRGRPRGSWISSQYRWSPADAWLPGGMADVPPEQARAELVRAWLAAYGPGSAADIKWWTGWTMGEVRRVLAGIGAAEVTLDGAVGYVLATDLEPVPAPEPWVALLPALDPTVMGWTGREFFLGGHGPALFDRSGNPGPTIWYDGRIVGGWAQRGSGEIAYRLLEDVGAEAATAIGAEAARLTGWLGEVRVTPRFRTPLERELSA